MKRYLIDPDAEIDSWLTELEKKIEKVMDTIAKVLLVGFVVLFLIVKFT